MKKLFYIITFFVASTTFINAQDWVDYKSEEFAFITKFPEQPKVTVQQVETEIGEIDMHVISYSPTGVNDNNVVYSVIRSDYPKEVFEAKDDEYNNSVLDGAVNGAVTNVNGELSFDKKIMHNGFPGRSIKIKIEGAFIYMNAILVNNMIYITQVVCMADKDENKDINRFMDSFDIIKVKGD